MNIVERLEEYVSRRKTDGDEPIHEKGHFYITNRFAWDVLHEMYQHGTDFESAIGKSGRGSYPEDLLALMSEDEIEQAYARWCVEGEDDEPS